MISLRCTPDAACACHADGGPAADKCPGVCDVEDCTSDIKGDDEDQDGLRLCAAHRARPGALRSVS